MFRSLFIITLLFTSIFLSTVLIGSCKKEQHTKNLTLLQQEIPTGFPQPVYKFEDNPLTEEGFQLGKKLFYDGRLSIDNEHSCNSCHQQIAGFGTYEHDRSHGVNHTHTLRNAPVLFNLAWNTSFHWDGEYATLRDAIAHPLNGSIETGETFETIIKKLEGDEEYRRLFKEVFHYPFIRPEFITKALAQFVGSFISANSRYDRYLKGTVTFTAQELNGYNLFKANCASCHKEPLFTDYSIRNNGLDIDTSLNDFGRMRITGLSSDSLKFKIPTLRNAYISANYMHDGRYNTLHQVIDHYRFTVLPSATLDPSLRNGIPLTNTQAADLFEFLRTLTDSSFLSNPRYSN